MPKLSSKLIVEVGRVKVVARMRQWQLPTSREHLRGRELGFELSWSIF